MKRSRANKGQFSVIAALLVSVILVTAIISTYTMVRYAPIQDSPKVLTAIGEMNSDIKQILDFTVGYYCSILKVTGNSTYARTLTTTYLSSGLVNIARSHPEWNPSFDLTSNSFYTSWFMPESCSVGNISVEYSLENLGINGINYETSSALEVTMLESDVGIARIMVTRDNAEPELGLTVDNFWFYNYTEDSNWELVNPTNIVISSNGIYNITLPSGIDPYAYSIHVKDSRGLTVSAFYSPSSVASESKIPHYTYSFDWESTGLLDIYEDLSTDNFVVELLQNGTLNWLGQPLEILPQAKPLPPVCVKAFRVNATINGVNQEVPFQIEDWASDYMVPLGLSSSESIFNRNNMIVFMVNNEVSDVTLWWDGNDTAIQTPYAQENNFGGDVSDTEHISLTNGKITLDVDINSAILVITSTYGFTSTQAEFSRINGERPVFHAGTSCVIYNGSVRAILQQEPEYSSGGATDLYAQLVLTLPVNTTYYTYASRMVFVDTTQSRTVNDLSVVQLSSLSGTPMTEDGTVVMYPNPSNSTGLFYDGSPTGSEHHWSQFVSVNTGAGVMFTDSANEMLYIFDGASEIGAVVVATAPNSIEVNPVELASVSFTTAKDLTWYGAVVTFGSEPIYHSGNDIGLWVMVEHPPVVAIDNYTSMLGAPLFGSDVDYVDNNLSNKDSKANKGAHSIFSAQKYGPDSISDTLTEEMSAVAGNVTVLDDGFEAFTWNTNWNDRYSHWREDTNPTHSGSSSAWASNGNEGYFTSDNLDASDATAIYVDFWFRKHNTESSDFTLFFYNGFNYDYIDELDPKGGDDTWLHYTAIITDSRYFISNFRIMFDATLGGSEDVWVDDVLITKEVTISTNYQLDIEVEWTHADFDEVNEQLCVYLVSSNGESLNVEVWTGSSWSYLTTLNVGWNNVTISSYLDSKTLTVRFVGATETGDTVQNYWAIDATLIRCWS